MKRGSIDLRELRFAEQRVPSRIIHAMPCPEGGNGVINPHVTLLGLADGRFSSIFHVKPIYYEDKNSLWKPLREVCTYHGNKHIILKPDALERMSFRFFLWLCKRQRLLGSELRFGYPHGVYAGVQPRDMMAALTLTAYPDPNPETVTVDGYVTNNPAGATTWDTAHDATAGTGAFPTADPWLISVNNTAGDYAINRGFTLFDTSALTSSATISAATASLYIAATDDSDNDGNDTIALVSSSPASNTNLVVGDFDQCGDAIDNPTQYATAIDIGTIGTAAYTDWVLTTLTIISKTSVTKMGWREGHDVVDSAPDARNRLDVTSAEGVGGTSTSPKLVVTYTLPASVGFNYAYIFG